MNQQDIIAKEGDIYWEIPEYEKHDRSRNWYIAAGVITFLLIVYAVYTQNYLFLGIIVLSAFVMYANDRAEPAMVPFIIGDEGIQIGTKFHDYDEIKNFCVLYKPNSGVKSLYFEFKSAAKMRLSVPLMEQDPLAIREALLRYLPEDLDRLHPPASEGLAKLLKL